MSKQVIRYNPIQETVEAVQFVGYENAQEIQRWWSRIFVVPEGYEHEMRTEKEHIKGTHSVHDNAPCFLVLGLDANNEIRVDIGTYLIKDSRGDISVMSAFEFGKRYQPEKPL